MTRAVILSCNTRNDLQNKVTAIKAVRSLGGHGLKEAKELVERVNPGHCETVQVSHDILEPRFSEDIAALKISGLTVKVVQANNKARRGLAEGIAGLVTYATMTAQYDISRALLDVMETYCPNPANEDEDEDEQEEQEDK